jgi:uncharacterized ferredoxin-like protein
MDVLKTAAELMAVSARTAPKAAGQDYVEIKVIGEDKIEKLAQEMIDYGKESGKGNFDRDGENVRKSNQVILLSLNEADVLGINCGACGFDNCKELKLKSGTEFDGPVCAWRLMDLGIAMGSAVKTASILNIDNRIMYRIGVAAKRLKLIDGEIVVGIPISASGKNIYFDR